MLPRLSSSRIVGVRYAGDTIRHEDLYLDFSVHSKSIETLFPGNAVIPFRNGGGKGVLLQLFMQPLSPLASWKGGKNKVEHFFWNREQKSIKYTFHVVHEFELDKHRRLLTGISVAPKLMSRARQKEGSSPIELDYILFLSEYMVDDEAFGITTLPLWDENTNKAVELAEWKEVIHNNYPLKMMQFSRSNEQQYLDLLNDYGITENTIHTLEVINSAENDVSSFFDKATDNHGLFYRKVVPLTNSALEASVNVAEKLDLAETFYEVLKIAQELPKILQISEAARQLTSILDPLILSYSQMISSEKKRETHAEKGYAIRKVLEEQQDELIEVVKVLERDLAGYEQQVNKIGQKQKNVEYMKKHQEWQTTKIEIENLSTEIEKLNRTVEELKNGIHELDINILVKDYHTVDTSITDNFNTIRHLETNFRLNDIVSQMEDIQSKFKVIWETKTYPSWQEKINQSEFLVRMHKENIHNLELRRDEQKKLQTQFEETQKLTNEATEQHEKQKKLMAQKFGEKIRLAPEEVKEDKNRELTHLQKERDKLRINMEGLKKELLCLAEKIGSTTKELELLGNDIQSSKMTLDSRAIEEEALVQCIADTLKVDIDLGFDQKPSREWVSLHKETIVRKLESEKRRYDEKLRELWKSELDSDLLEESKKINGRIPNHALVKARDKIEQQGVKCRLGSHLLGSLSTMDRETELARNPLLPYSIVMMEEDFEKVDFSFFREEHMEAAVFVVPRQKMGNSVTYPLKDIGLQQYGDSNYILQDESFSMWFDKELWENWMRKVEEAQINSEFDLEFIQQAIKRFEFAHTQIEKYLVGKMVIELELELSKSKKKASDMKGVLDEFSSKSLLNEQNKEHIELHLSQQERFIRQMENDLIVVEEWVRSCGVYQKNLGYLVQLEKEIGQAKEAVKAVEEKLIEEKQTLETIGDRYVAWKTKANTQLTKIQAIVSDAVFPLTTMNFEGDSIHPDFEVVVGSEAAAMIQRYDDLTKQQNNMDTQIAVRREENKNLLQRKNEIEVAFAKFQVEREDFEVPSKTIIQMKSEKEKTQNEMVSQMLERSNQDGVRNEKTKFFKALESEQQRMEEEFKRNGYEVEIWEDFQYELFRRTYIAEKNKYENLVHTVQREISKQLSNKKTISLLLDNLREELVQISSYRLDDEEIKDIQLDPEHAVKEWMNQKYQIDEVLREQQKIISSEYDSLFNLIEANGTMTTLVKEPLLEKLKILRQSSTNNKETSELLLRIKEWAEKEAEDQLIQKQKAEDAVTFWSDRVNRRVVLIINSIKTMVSRMKVRNSRGRFVELVRFKHGTKFPESKNEIASIVKSYCIRQIQELMEEYGSAEKVPKSQISKRTHISEIMLSVMGEFPRIQLYIPDASGNFLKEDVKPHLYKEWNVINNGGDKESSKSGGQTLMSHLIVLCMLLKQQNQDDSPGLLITDNMFGEMSAPELIEPLFVALELLQVQWITFCPPNLKLDITSKFDTVYSLDIGVKNGVNSITSKVQKYQRKYMYSRSAISHAKMEQKIDSDENVS
ncbi:hypothetical protein [Paenibacillus xylanexedens]|uniref:hypothetical protein n=1 Tax=Paenibacillus xylanexedens TaxID=528191 RepID=UPI0011A1DF8E|nr:hypothetical protein [Paenibacillus xylanexedens]